MNRKVVWVLVCTNPCYCECESVDVFVNREDAYAEMKRQYDEVLSFDDSYESDITDDSMWLKSDDAEFFWKVYESEIK